MTRHPMTSAQVADAQSRFPQAFGPPIWVRGVRWAVSALAFVYLFYLGVQLELISTKFVSGIDQTGTIISQMWPPVPDSQDRAEEVFLRLGETLGMAFLGTLIGGLIAVPLGFIGARTVLPNVLTHFAIRRVFDMFRGMPVLIWALVYTRAVGLGPMTGVLAIATADAAALSKLYAEAIENSDLRETEGVRAAGAGPLMLVRFGLLPQVLPIMLSQALYFFESNVRSATILGIVGAGGIGTILSEAIRFNDWGEVAFIILMILIMVAVIDFGSRKLRERLIGAQQR